MLIANVMEKKCLLRDILNHFIPFGTNMRPFSSCKH